MTESPLRRALPELEPWRQTVRKLQRLQEWGEEIEHQDPTTLSLTDRVWFVKHSVTWHLHTAVSSLRLLVSSRDRLQPRPALMKPLLSRALESGYYTELVESGSLTPLDTLVNAARLCSGSQVADTALCWARATLEASSTRRAESTCTEAAWICLVNSGEDMSTQIKDALWQAELDYWHHNRHILSGTLSFAGLLIATGSTLAFVQSPLSGLMPLQLGLFAGCELLGWLDHISPHATVLQVIGDTLQRRRIISSGQQESAVSQRAMDDALGGNLESKLHAD